MNRALTAAAVILPLFALTLGVSLMTGTARAACPDTAVQAGTTTSPSTSATAPTVASDQWDDEQLTNARIIASVGASLGVPPQGQVIALATALQESGLRNLRHGDRDSLGLFQQRPSPGWGTPEQILTPTHAATRYYQALLRVTGWQQLPLSQAADAVQRSAHLTAYADHESDAQQLLAVVTGSAGAQNGVDPLLSDPECLAGGGDGQPSATEATLPAGYTLPADTAPQVRTAIAWALGQLGTSYSYGGDCTDPHSGNPARQCDCSSLVQQAYAHAGIRIPRTTRDQVHAGSSVPNLAQIEPGDLVFIPGANGTPARPSHVGLYVGSGLIVQAPRTGSNVKITKLAAWSPTVAAVRRIRA
jgi:cell wall-associated NlpC family hydrolase